jgi:hypothetical protein
MINQDVLSCTSRFPALVSLRTWLDVHNNLERKKKIATLKLIQVAEQETSQKAESYAMF